MKQITEEQFYNQYELIENHIDDNSSFNGNMFETFGDELTFVKNMSKENRVITIIEGDEDFENEFGEPTLNMFYVSGMHLVNRIGYLVTKEPITEEFEVKLE
mgnify:CR=1|tara:strand:+ start:5193 stop:5498 length:306 start_codon:yes stop_codon:yes gene_type:complete